MKIALKNCKFVISQNSKRDILEDIDVLIYGNKIQKLGKNLRGDKEIDCSNNIVMPGLINLHSHTGMHLLRGIADDMKLERWLNEKIWPAEKKLTSDKIYVGATMAIEEMLSTGTTCFNDMYFEMEQVAKAVKEIGIRAVLSHGIIALTQNKIKEEFARTKKFAEYVKKINCSRIKFAVGPHAPYTCSKQTLLKAKEIAKKHKAKIHIHVAETRKELANSLKEKGLRPVEYLEKIGFLNKDVIIAHACWITKGEIKTLAKRRVAVAHCPRSNMKLASGGIMPLREMEESGILVGLGTDSAVSNNNLDMFEEMRAAALVQKQNYWDATAAPAQKVLDMATINGAKALGINAGSIEKGKFADIILLNANHLLLQPLERERLISHLVYSANGSCVQKVFVDGKCVFQRS